MVAHKLRIFALMVIALLPMQVIGQSSFSLDEYTLVTIDTGAYPRQAMWSNDSKRFVFYEFTGLQDPQVNLVQPNWVQYDTVSQTTTRHNRWPLQPQLSTEELAKLTPAKSSDGAESLVFESPQGNYIACLCGGITVYSRLQEAFVNLPYTVIEPFKGPDEFQVLWSWNEEAFVYTTRDVESYGPGFLGYATNFMDRVENAELSSTQTKIDGKPYQILLRDIHIVSEKIHDISYDGRYVLQTLRHSDLRLYSYDQTPLKLIVWDANDPDSSYVIDDIDTESIKGASFVEDSNTDLLIVNDDELIRYDALTGNHTTLISDIAVTEAYFSPDSRFAALTCCYRVGDVRAVTILDLQPLVPAVVPTPTAED